MIAIVEVIFLTSSLVFVILSIQGQFSQNLYIDEHAIEPRSSFPIFDKINEVSRFDDEIFASNLRPQEFIYNKLNEIGLDAYMFDSGAVYGIHHAPRTDGSEALLILVHYNQTTKRQSKVSMPSGLAIITLLVSHLTTMKWLARNLIILAVDTVNSTEIVDKWLQIYHSDSHEFENFGRAGIIRIALIADIPFDSQYNSFSLIAGGGWGLLPNLDLISTVNSVFLSQQVILLYFYDFKSMIFIGFSE